MIESICENCAGIGKIDDRWGKKQECNVCQAKGWIPGISCRNCKGSGQTDSKWNADHKEECIICKGRGWFDQKNIEGRLLCENCSGSGLLPDKWDPNKTSPCPNCEGKGSVIAPSEASSIDDSQRFHMRNIDEELLEKNVDYRFNYFAEFIGFQEYDHKVLSKVSSLLEKEVVDIVEQIYKKLFTYDCTKRHFVPRQHGYEGETPVSLEELKQPHPQIVFRKQHLVRYIRKLLVGPYDGKLANYMLLVGKMHTSQVGNRDLHIPLVQVNAMMGYLHGILIDKVMGSGEILGFEKKSVLQALTKLLWIQNDLFQKAYHDFLTQEKASPL